MALSIASLELYASDYLEGPLLPHLKKQEERGSAAVRNLLFAHEAEFPGALSRDRNSYETSLEDLTQNQRLLKKALDALPGYADLIKKRQELITIKIKVKEELRFQARIFDASRLDDYSRRLQKSIASLDSEDFISDFPQQFLGKGFYKQKINSSHVIQFILAYGLSKRGQFPEELSKDIRLDESHIDFLRDELIWGPALELLAKKISSEYKQSNFLEAARKRMSQWAELLNGDTRISTEILSAGDELTLVEVHPDLAVLRGYVANDCATSCSFGFPYSPFERTFYIRDSKKTFLGYVALSVTEVQGKKTIFLHTITGPRLSFAQTQLILSALFRHKKIFGVSGIVLPENHRIDENVNFSAPRRSMMQSVSGVGFERVTWLDEEIRKVIEQHGSSLTYDDPEINQLGRRLNPNKLKIGALIVRRPYLSELESLAVPTRAVTTLKLAKPFVPCRDVFKKTALKNRR